jgi:3-deoxy-7-phosphoheptulonate synthase
MRVYFEKPRTTTGWKGLITDPELNGEDNMAEGIRIAREIMAHINNLGVPTATEWLDPLTPAYLGDTVTW